MRYLRYLVYFMLLVLVDYYMSKYVSYNNKELVPMLMKSAALLATAFSLIYIEQRLRKNKKKSNKA